MPITWTMKSAAPPPITWTPVDIYIPSQPSSTNRLIENLDRIVAEVQRSHPGELITHVDDLIRDANRLTKGLDTKQLQDKGMELLDNLHQASASLQMILDDPQIATILNNTSGATANLRTLSDPKDSELAKLLADLHQPPRSSTRF